MFSNGGKQGHDTIELCCAKLDTSQKAWNLYDFHCLSRYCN